MSGKVDITPADVSSAANTFAREQSALEDTWDHLAQVLEATQGMAGNDKAAATFAAHYDPAIKAVWSAFGAGIRTLAGVANGLVTTANNYLKAEAHSTARGSRTPQQFSPPAVVYDVVMPSPAPSKGDGDSDVPEFLQKFWPNGHPDQLRNAADGWTMAAQSLEDLTTGLSQAVTSITDNNRTDCLAAMQEFWDALAGPDGLFGELADTCHQLATACNRYAQTIDDAHDRLKTALIEAGITIGLTTAAGVLLSVVTFGASDVAAAEADVVEAEAIAGPIVEEFEATVATEAQAAIGADVAASLESVAADAPTVTAVEAETTEVQSAVEEELQATEETTGKPIEPAAAPQAQQINEVLEPHGEPIGQPGNRPGTRLVSEEQLEQTWAQLRQRFGEPETITTPKGDIQVFRFENGEQLVYRPFSNTGGATIDVRVPRVSTRIVHLGG